MRTICILAALLIPLSALGGMAETASTETRLSKMPIVVSVGKDGLIYLGDEQEKTMTVEALASKMKAIAEAEGGAAHPVFVRGVGDVFFKTVARAMSEIRKAGFKKLSIVTVDEVKAPQKEAPKGKISALLNKCPQQTDNLQKACPLSLFETAYTSAA